MELGPGAASSISARCVGRNSPTDPAFIVTGEKDFDTEKQRLARLVKHLDHHLRQFGC